MISKIHLVGALWECSKTAVHNAIAKTRQLEFFVTKNENGRPRKTSVRDDRKMQRMVVRLPMSSCKKV